MSDIPKIPDEAWREIPANEPYRYQPDHFLDRYDHRVPDGEGLCWLENVSDGRWVRYVDAQAAIDKAREEGRQQGRREGIEEAATAVEGQTGAASIQTLRFLSGGIRALACDLRKEGES